MASIEGVTLGGGALLGTILAALGLRKLVKGEVNVAMDPERTKINSIQTELTELKQTGLMTEASHKLICNMNAKYIDERMSSVQKSIDLQIDGVKEHIDTKFSELTRRLDRRRNDD